MRKISELDFGFADAQNYKRRENKNTFNKVFIKNDYLTALCSPGVSFLIGEKGTGKTAYAVYLANNTYKNNRADIKYIRETEYSKFISLKKEKHLQLSDYTSIWKVILYLLLSKKIDEVEGSSFSFRNLARHPRYISPWDIHVQRFTPLGRINRGPQYVLRPASTPHKSRSVKTYLTDLTAFREKIFASLACYRTRRIGKFPCGLLRTKNHHFACAPFP